MARLWSCGLELASQLIEWDNASGTFTFSTTTVRSGTYSLNVTGLISAERRSVRTNFKSANNNGPFYLRTYFRVATLPSAENRIIATITSDSIVNQKVYITINNAGVLKLYDEDGQITGTTTLSVNIWYRIEILFDITAAAGSHVITAKVDGVDFATASDRNLSIGIQGIAIGGNLATEAQTTGNWFFDDIAINDSTGSFQNSYPGAGSIVHLRPNATGDNSELFKFPNSGESNYQNVDEVTPDDATTYNYSDFGGEFGNTDDYNIDNAPASIGATDDINLISVGVRYNGEGASANAGFKVRAKKASAGTVLESAEIIPANTTWVTNTNAVPRNYSLTLYQTPDSESWTKALLDTSQIGVKITTSDTNAAQISTLWMLVEYSPAVGGGEVLSVDYIGGEPSGVVVTQI